MSAEIMKFSLKEGMFLRLDVKNNFHHFYISKSNAAGAIDGIPKLKKAILKQVGNIKGVGVDIKFEPWGDFGLILSIELVRDSFKHNPTGLIM